MAEHQREPSFAEYNTLSAWCADSAHLGVHQQQADSAVQRDVVNVIGICKATAGATGLTPRSEASVASASFSTDGQVLRDSGRGGDRRAGAGFHACAFARFLQLLEV